jgi:hypothetical protein
MKLAGMTLIAACAAASAAAADPSPDSRKDAETRKLLGAAFAKPAQGSLRNFSAAPASTLSVRPDAVAAPPFAPPAVSGTRLDQPSLLAGDRYLPGEGLVRWRTGEAVVGGGGNAVDALRFSVGGVARGPGGEATDEAFDVTYTRGWVSALRGRVDDELSFDITPRAGLGVSNAGGQAIAGAMIRVGDLGGSDIEDRVKDRLSSMVSDGSRFGDRGRWYVFAAADGRAVGLNILRGENGWSRQGLTTDAAAVIGEAQVGVGWRKGAMQASFGVLHREMKTKPAQGLDEHQVEDQAIAFTLSIKPGK